MIGPKVSGKPRFTTDRPITYPVGAAIAAGQLAKAGSGGTAGQAIVATANAAALGVATTPGLPAGASNTNTSPSGYPAFEASPMPESSIAFARSDAYYLLATGTIGFLDFVKCGAAGSVVKWDPTADALIPQVGQCIDVNGGTNGSAVLIDLAIRG